MNERFSTVARVSEKRTLATAHEPNIWKYFTSKHRLCYIAYKQNIKFSIFICQCARLSLCVRFRSVRSDSICVSLFIAHASFVHQRISIEIEKEWNLKRRRIRMFLIRSVFLVWIAAVCVTTFRLFLACTAHSKPPAETVFVWLRACLSAYVCMCESHGMLLLCDNIGWNWIANVCGWLAVCARACVYVDVVVVVNTHTHTQ